MSIRAEIIKQNGDEVTLKLFDKLDERDLKKQAINGRYYVTMDIFEKDSITDLQREHFYALCGDIEKYEGIPQDAVVSFIKVKFMQEEGLDEYPSVARNQMKMNTASKLLEFTINHCFDKEIPFRKQQFYLTTDTSKMLFAFTMKRICWICGKEHSDIAHVESVGMGRDRREIDHTQHRFMCLCREHHNEQHNIGINNFMDLYHIKPIKLKEEQLKELGVM